MCNHVTDFNARNKCLTANVSIFFFQTPILNQSDEIYTTSKPKKDSVRCGSCNHPTTEAKCRLFCEPCDMFICKDCTYHVNVANGAEERDDDYLHETNVTVGMYDEK